MNEAIPSVDDTQSVIEQTSKLIQETKDKVDEIDGKFQDNFQVIESTKNQIQQSKDENGSASIRIDNLVNVENAFKSIEDLVDSSKQMIANVYGIISSCDVLDSETVSAAASLIGETRQLIAEYTSLYKQRIKFFDNVKMEMLKQDNRERLLKLKYQLDLEKMDRKNSTPAQAEDVTGKDNGEVPPGMVQTSSIDVLKLIQEVDEEDEEIVEESEQ